MFLRRFGIPIIFATILAAIPAVATAAAPDALPLAAPPRPSLVRVVTGAEAWEGTVRVTEPVSVEKGATLTIAAGTTVLLSGVDANGDGCRDGVLQVVGGTLRVLGEPGRPVVFKRLDGKLPWEEIFLKDADATIRHAVFEGSTGGIHVHDGSVAISQTVFSGNGFGMRMKGIGVTVERSTFRGNDVGIRFWEGGPQVTASRFDRNGTALFYRDGVGGGSIEKCLFDSVEWDLKVGDWAKGDVEVKQSFSPGGVVKVRDFRDGAAKGRLVVDRSTDSPPNPVGAE